MARLFRRLICISLAAAGVLLNNVIATEFIVIDPLALLSPDKAVQAQTVDRHWPVSETSNSHTDTRLINRADMIEWERMLKGRTLHYIRSGNGMSINKYLNLCSDHSFRYSDSDSYISHDAFYHISAAVRGREKGRWKIIDDRLLLLWSDKSQTELVLSYRFLDNWGEWAIFIDDELWYNETNKVCH